MCIKRRRVCVFNFLSVYSPLDPIHTSSHRIVYLVAYGAVAGELVHLITLSASRDTSGGIGFILVAG